MMNSPTPTVVDLRFAVPDGMVALAREFTRIANAQAPARRAPRRGSTLRPGKSTPMWNALAQLVLPYLEVRGEKAKLSRILGVPAPRLHEYLMAKTAMPDAERTLILVHWLAERRTGHSLG